MSNAVSGLTGVTWEKDSTLTSSTLGGFLTLEDNLVMKIGGKVKFIILKYKATSTYAGGTFGGSFTYSNFIPNTTCIISQAQSYYITSNVQWNVTAVNTNNTYSRFELTITAHQAVSSNTRVAFYLYFA